MKSPELEVNDKLYIDVDLRINKIKGKKKLYVLTYRFLKVSIFIAGAVISVIVGWKQISDLPINTDNWILTISVGITLLVAIESLFDLKDKAWSYDVLTFELRKLRSQMAFDFYKDAELFKSKKEEYFKKLEAVLESQKSIIENSYNNGD